MTSRRSSVFSGDFAWHSEERKVVKSCSPTSERAAARMRATLSPRDRCQTRLLSRAGGPRRQRWRILKFRGVLWKRGRQSRQEIAATSTALGEGNGGRVSDT